MKHQCDNCGAVYCDLPHIPLVHVSGLNLRLEPGSVVPSGECKCGAFTYLVKPKKKGKR